MAGCFAGGWSGVASTDLQEEETEKKSHGAHTQNHPAKAPLPGLCWVLETPEQQYRACPWGAFTSLSEPWMVPHTPTISHPFKHLNKTEGWLSCRGLKTTIPASMCPHLQPPQINMPLKCKQHAPRSPTPAHTPLPARWHPRSHVDGNVLMATASTGVITFLPTET